MSADVYPSLPVLLVDDEPSILELLRRGLQHHGIGHTHGLTDGNAVLPWLEKNRASLVILDLQIAEVSGQEVLAALQETQPELPAIILTGNTELKTAVSCLRLGARDFLTKPIDILHLSTTVRAILESCELESAHREFASRAMLGDIEHAEAFRGIVTQDSKMRAAFQYIESVARTRHPVLITGESGVGKDLMARALHRVSGRSGPLIAENLGGLDDTAFTDALFGHTRGAFTGADAERRGLMAQAEGGTLFLDEIGDLSPVSQVKLLRVLQDYEYRPLGSDRIVRANVRFVMATNRDLNLLREAGHFRQDLFYRLNTHHLRVPPLRERKGDLPLLIAHFLARGAEDFGRPKPPSGGRLLPLLENYAFPGNVRELEHIIYDALAQSPPGMLALRPVREYLREMGGAGDGIVPPDSIFNWADVPRLPSPRYAMESLIEEALRRTGGNQSEAARLLGISRTALHRRAHAAGNGE